MRHGGCSDSVEPQGRKCDAHVEAGSSACTGGRNVAVVGTRAAAAPSRGAVLALDGLLEQIRLQQRVRRLMDTIPQRVPHPDGVSTERPQRGPRSRVRNRRQH